MMKQDALQPTRQPRKLTWSDWGGMVLFFVGLLFIGVNLLGVGRLENWWGLFILLPGVVFFGMGWQARSGNGRFPFLTRLSLGSGLVVTTVALMFLFNLNWAIWWPLMIIMPGAALWIVGAAAGGLGVTAVLHWGRWISVTMILLGLTFLAEQLTPINLQAMIGNFHWWGIFTLIPGIGAFVEAVRVLRRATWAATGLLIVGVWILSAGVMELLDPNWISWEGMVGIGLIGTGLMSRVWLMAQPVAD